MEAKQNLKHKMQNSDKKYILTPPVLDRDTLQVFILRASLNADDISTLSQLVTDFILTGEEQIVRIKEQIQQNKFDDAAQSCLNLMGSCCKIGVMRLASVCIDLENVIRRRVPNAVEQYTKALEHEYESACKALKRELVSQSSRKFVQQRPLPAKWHND